MQWLEQAVTELSADASELSQEYALLLIAYAHAKLSDLGIPAERYSVVLGEDQAGNARVEVAVPGSEVDRVASEFASAPQQSGLLQVLRKVDRGPAALDIMYSYQFKPSLLDGDVIQTGRVWAELTRALQNGCGAELDSDSEVGSSTALRVNTHWNYYDRGGKVGFLFKARFVLGYTDSANDGEPAGEYGQISLEQELLVRRRSASQWRRVPVEDLSTIGSSTSPATRCLDVISTSVRDQG